ncbi:MAG TPA: hypothetical protein EYO33_18370 [Phycisphaerales bacterium]|nr:hypothetical protein [Phycisphaerales bacterium]
MSLLERFREGSKYTEDGEFTLDEKRAQKKMASFQLSSMEEAVLLAVQALNSAGCTRLEVTLTSEHKPKGQRVRLCAFGARLDKARLQSCREEVFATDSDSLPYHLLGVAFNSVENECVDSPVLEMLENGEIVFRFQSRQIIEGLDEALRSRVRYSAGEVFLNGEELPQKPVSGTQVDLASGLWTRLTLIRFGVVVETEAIKTVPTYSALLASPDFRLDASYSHVVQDKIYSEALARAQKLALQRLAEAASDPSPEMFATLRRYAAEITSEPAASALKKAKIFPLADRDEYCSLHDMTVGTSKKTLEILTSQKRFNLRLDRPVVLLEGGNTAEVLGQIFAPEVLIDAGPAYRRKLQAEQNKARWQSSPRSTELPPGEYHLREKLEDSKWQAEIGLLKNSLVEPKVDVLYQNRLLAADNLTHLAPPGSVAVINFEELEVDELWSRGTGRIYRSAISALNKKVRELFDKLPPFPQGNIDPAMRHFLMERICGPTKSLSRVDLETPLFAESMGKEVYSLEQLAAGGKIFIGKPFRPKSENFPLQILPNPLIWTTRGNVSGLKKRLGKANVVELSSADFERFQEIDAQLLDPPPLSLERLEGVSFLARQVYRKDNVFLEVGFREKRESHFMLHLIHEGVTLEKKKHSSDFTFEGVAVLSAGSLQPKSDWSGMKTGASDYAKLLELVNERFKELELSMLKDKSVDRSIRLTLLASHLDLVSEFESEPWFPTVHETRRLSLRELRKELDEHGHVLCLGQWISASRPVLLTPDNHELELLQKFFGNRWKTRRADLYMDEEKRRKMFLNKDVVEKIRLPGEFTHKVSLSIGRGELGFRCLEPSGDGGGSLFCYIDGRLAETKRNILPRDCFIAIEHEDITLSRDFKEVNVKASLVSELKGLCALEAVPLLSHENRAVASWAFAWMQQLSHNTLPKDEILKSPIVRLYGGGVVSMEEVLKKHSKSIPFVEPDFSVRVKTNRMIVFEKSSDIKFLLKLAGSRARLNDMQRTLHVESQREKFLNSLDTKLADHLKARSFESKTLKGLLAVDDKSRLLGFDAEENVLGFIDWHGLPVSGNIFGLEPAAHSSQQYTDPAPEFPRPAREVVEQWTYALYLEWVEGLCHDSLGSAERERALSILNRVSRFITSCSNCPGGKLAQVLWDLPLFLRADGTWMSGSALALKFTEEQAPILMTESSFRAPADVLVLDTDSEGHKVLRAVLGAKNLLEFERPPLVDTERIVDSARQLVAWGLTPFKVAQNKVDVFVEMLTLRRQERQAQEENFLEKSRRQRNKNKDKEEEKGPPTRQELENQLLRRFHSDLNQLLGRRVANKAETFFAATSFGTWPLGPAVYRSPTSGQHRFNRLHPAVRWLIDTPTKGNARHREARLLILLAWVGLVNIASEELTDKHEDEFLIKVAERLEQSLH